MKASVKMKLTNEKRSKRNLAIFSVLVLGLASLAGAIEPLTKPEGAEPGAAGLGQLLWLITPLVIAVLLRIVGGDGWDDLGLRPNFKGNGLWWFVSALVFPVVFTITVLIGVPAGGLQLDANMLPVFASILGSTFIMALVKNLFEEFAWRGYLAPKVYSLELNPWFAHAIVGLIWGGWHLPFVFAFWPYLSTDMLWYFIPLLLLGTVSQSVVYGEIRLATASLLPAWVMHTVGNVLGNSLLFSGLIRLAPGREIWFSPGVESVSSIVLMFAAGYLLHQRRITIRSRTYAVEGV